MECYGNWMQRCGLRNDQQRWTLHGPGRGSIVPRYYGYSNKRVDELLLLGAKEQDDTKRKAQYDEIQKLVMDDLPNYYMITLKNVTAFDKKVRDIVPLKGGDILRQNNLQVIDWWLES